MLQGGKFRHGFAAAGVTKGFDANFNMEGTGTGAFVGETVIVAMDGTVSELTGGKFANGAFTATFQHLFNELSAAQAAHKDAVEKRIAELVKSGMAVVREMRITITISGHPVTAVADFAYLLDDELVLGEVKTGAEAKFSPAQKKAYWAAIENKMFSISDDAKTGLGLEKGRGSSLTIRAVEIIAPAGSRALGEAARKTYGKAFTKVVGGAFTLIGSTTVMGAELLLTSADAGYGSDCVGCLYNDRPKE